MDPFIGEVKIFGGNFPPEGWHYCNGAQMPIVTYQVLYAIIGTAYGGNGVTTFNLPDLRGKVPIGWGSSAFGQFLFAHTGGSENNVLTQLTMPYHNHTATAASGVSGNIPPTTGTVTIETPVSTGKGITPSASPVNNFYSSSSSGTSYATPAGGGNMAPFTTTFNPGPPALTIGTVVNIDSTGSNTPAPFSIMQPFVAMNYVICVYGGGWPSRN